VGKGNELRWENKVSIGRVHCILWVVTYPDLSAPNANKIWCRRHAKPLLCSPSPDACHLSILPIGHRACTLIFSTPQGSGSMRGVGFAQALLISQPGTSLICCSRSHMSSRPRHQLSYLLPPRSAPRLSMQLASMVKT